MMPCLLFLPVLKKPEYPFIIEIHHGFSQLIEKLPVVFRYDNLLYRIMKKNAIALC